MGRILILLSMLAVISGCVDDDIDKGTSDGTGTIHVKVNYDGQVPEGTVVTAAVMNCPFIMPPLMLTPPSFPVTTFPAEGDLENIPAGDICVYVYIDVDSTDGFQPDFDRDPVNLLADGEVSIPVSIKADQVVNLDLDFGILNQDSPDVLEPSDVTEEGDAGEVIEGVQVRLELTCPTCTSNATVRFYGNKGQTLGMPEFFLEIDEPVFPKTMMLPRAPTLAGTKVDWPEGEVILQAYQNTIPGGMQAEAGEPVSDELKLTLEAGVINEVKLELK